jgi:hypothetical protein
LSDAPRGGVGTTAVVAIVVAMIVLVVGVGAFFESQGPPVTSLTTFHSSSATTACVFSSPSALQASSALTASFSGCLGPGASGTYLIAADGQGGLNMSGTFSAKLPIGVTVAGAAVEALSPAAGTIYQANDTASVTLSGVILEPGSGYAVTLTNEGAQNSTVTMDIQLTPVT